MDVNSTDDKRDWRSREPQPLYCTSDFIAELFYRVDQAMAGVPRHPQARLWPGELVTLAILYALKGVDQRAFYRWAYRDLRPLFPGLPDRTRLFRLFATHRDWAARFLADPTFFGVADSFGVEMINTLRLGRSWRQIGRRGRSHGSRSRDSACNELAPLVGSPCHHAGSPCHFVRHFRASGSHDRPAALRRILPEQPLAGCRADV
jgi:hypothetical protein